MKKKVKLNTSSIHNKGLFATEDIPKGTKIIEYVGEKITKAEGEKRADKVAARNKKNPKKKGAVYIFDLNKRYDLDGDVSYNIAKWINHSCRPNCEAVNERGHIWIISTKKIKKGEELVYNYSYEYDTDDQHPCRCHSDNCVGYILDRKYWKKVKKIQKPYKKIT